ncbi:hypothetical protein CNMCM8927_003678 [Aspergillus lentulus]|uniref:Protein RTM1 n=1 Tax=Aspergillus lentulus TaxID=293939 RepID=A0AAN6BK24_ASPLE|nr:hypothetical protein CNMCM7927_000981 [Aspergillus lentulus]KAF4200231.1 hypothetical protein CNMCM8927_003678 [Aspergillus lentulus]
MKATVGEAFGYYGRAASSLDPAKTGPFILQTLLILVAAPLLAATLYMSMGRMIEALSAQKFSCMSPRWMTRIYVLVDIACIITQFMGAGMMSSGDPSKLAASKTLIVGGLITQFVAVIFFILLCCRIHMKLRAEVWVGVVRWTSAFIAIEAIGVLLLIRNVVRAVEYLQGSGGFVVSHEFFIYACDALPMWLMMVLLLVFHPGRIIQQVGSVKGREGLDGTHILLANQ